MLKQIQTGGIPLQPAQVDLFATEAVAARPSTWPPVPASFIEADRSRREQSSRDAVEAFNREQPALLPCLRIAVAMCIVKFQQVALCVVVDRARDLADVVASEADVLFRPGKPGQTARAFNALAEGLAALSFQPGGVRFLGMHFEAQHPDTELESRP